MGDSTEESSTDFYRAQPVPHDSDACNCDQALSLIAENRRLRERIAELEREAEARGAA